MWQGGAEEQPANNDDIYNIYTIYNTDVPTLGIVKWWQGGAEEQPAVDSSAWDPRCLQCSPTESNLTSSSLQKDKIKDLIAKV